MFLIEIMYKGTGHLDIVAFGPPPPHKEPATIIQIDDSLEECQKVGTSQTRILWNSLKQYERKKLIWLQNSMKT